MKIRMLAATPALILCAFSAIVGLARPAAAQVINLDVEGDPPNDTTHSGADGVLSGAGLFWNGIPTGVDVTGLLDESGAATGVDVVFASTGGGATNGSSTNDLQDSGTLRSFDVTGLSDSDSYDVAIYGFPFSFVALTDASGTEFVSCTGSPTYSLPGSQDDDYCLFEDRLAADLGGGEFGFTIQPLDGIVAGVQISGAGAPSVPSLSPPGLVGLTLGLMGVGTWWSRSRRYS